MKMDARRNIRPKWRRCGAKMGEAGLNRRALNWNAVRGPKAIVAFWTATAGGAGLAPWAPGTAGTLVGIPIAYFTNDWALGARIALWLGLLALGTWAAAVFDQMM